MKHGLGFLVLLACLLGTVSVSADTRSEINAALDYFSEIWNEGDLEAMRGYYHPEFVAISANGKETLAQRLDTLKLLFQPGEDRGRLSFTGVVVEPLENEHAMAYGHMRLKFKDGTELDSWFNTVYVKTPFGWKALLNHN